MGRSEMGALTLEDMVVGHNAGTGRSAGLRASRTTNRTRWLLIGCGLLLAELLVGGLIVR